MEGRGPVSREPIKAKSVRVPDALWRAAQTKANQRGEILSEVIRAALEKYVKRQ
jgi:predicted transcriptional regulator